MSRDLRDAPRLDSTTVQRNMVDNSFPRAASHPPGTTFGARPSAREGTFSPGRGAGRV